MNKLNIFACLMGGMLALSSCEKYDDLVPSEYHNVLNIKHHGLQKVTLYTTGDDPTWSFTVMKGGSEANYQSQATIEVMSEAEFDEYCANNNVLAKLLPSEYYVIPETELTFSEEETYKIVNVQFKVSEIKELMKSTGKKYALPIVMKSSVSNVNNNLIIPELNIETPTLSFDLAGGNQFVPGVTLTQSGEAKVTAEINVLFPTTNQWDFTFDVTTNDKASQAFEKYNESQNGKYQILPESAYTFNGKGISYPKNADRKSVV